MKSSQRTTPRDQAAAGSPNSAWDRAYGARETRYRAMVMSAALPSRLAATLPCTSGTCISLTTLRAPALSLPPLRFSARADQGPCRTSGAVLLASSPRAFHSPPVLQPSAALHGQTCCTKGL